MGAPYSQDLRLRVLKAIDQGLSKVAVHQTFGVSRSTVDDWLEFREETGQVAAKTAYYRGRRPVLEDTAEVRAFIERYRYGTLSQMVEAWFDKVLRPVLQPGQVIILDNASYHRKTKLRALLEPLNCWLLALPTYSPDLNLIEPLWHQLKAHIHHNQDLDLSLHHKAKAAFCSL